MCVRTTFLLAEFYGMKRNLLLASPKTDFSGRKRGMAKLVKFA
jgi:hypothetical protein